MKDTSQMPVIRQLLGSLDSGHAYLFHGDRGSGKSVLGMQCAHTWLRAGGAVLCITNSRPGDYFQQASELGFPLEGHWRSQQLILSSLDDDQLALFAREGAEELLGRFDALVDKLPVAGVVIESLDLLIEAAGKSNRQHELLTALIDGLAHRKWTTLLLGGRGLKGNEPVRHLLAELCRASVALHRPGTRLWDRLRGEKPSGVVVLDLEKARQPTPGVSGLTCEVRPGVGLLPVTGPCECRMPGATPLPEAELTRALFISAEPGLFDPLIELLEGTVEVEVVEEGVEGLARAVTWAPQVILSETDLPRLSGFGIARALRQGRYGMPIVLFSRAARRHTERVRAYLNGATDFVYYPYDAREMVYKVRVLSQMIQRRFPEGVEEQMMDALLSKARSHYLNLPAFLQALSLSLHTGVRLSAPVSLLGFTFDPGDGVQEVGGIWEHFKKTVDAQARNGDLICMPSDDSLAVLFCHETQYGTKAFAKRLLHKLAEDGYAESVSEAGWSIALASETIQLHRGDQPDLKGLLEQVFAKSHPFLGQGAPLPATSDSESIDDEEAPRRWGT